MILKPKLKILYPRTKFWNIRVNIIIKSYIFAYAIMCNAQSSCINQ